MARILVIEDHDQLREALEEMLVRAGYDVMTAAGGDEGVTLYRKKPPDVVITDIIMPNKDGTEIIFDLQRNFPAVKIIAITGGSQGNAEDYLRAITSITNVARTFSKPFAMGEMLRAVKELLNPA